jgi:predicted Zn-dependent protease with MMP-like domain
MPSFSTPPTLDDIVALADRALGSVPSHLAQNVRALSIVVEEIADDDTLDDMGMESGYDLTGLYRGTPMHLRSANDTAQEPDMIFLYREPILLEWIETGEDLYRLVRNVLIHEVAHHFGFDDAQIAALEAE